MILVVPENQGEYQGSLQLSLSEVGQVKKGQQVMIDLLDPPHSGNETLKGTIDQISTIPFEGQYLVEVSLEKGVFAGKPLMQGTARVITEDKRLLERFFKLLLQLLN